MIVVKKDERVPASPVTTGGVSGVTKQILIGPEDGSGNIIMRFFTVAEGGYTDFHRHPYEHVVHVQKGRGAVIHPDGKETPLEPGMSVFVPGGVDHRFRNTSGEPFEFICTIPNPERKAAV